MILGLVLTAHAWAAPAPAKTTTKLIKVVKMPLLNINRVIAEHFGGGAPDFLSIDIEGLDFAVLKTLGYSRRRGRTGGSGKMLALYGIGALLLGFGGLALIINLLAPSEPTAPNQRSAAVTAGTPATSGRAPAAPPTVDPTSDRTRLETRASRGR